MCQERALLLHMLSSFFVDIIQKLWSIYSTLCEFANTESRRKMRVGLQKISGHSNSKTIGIAFQKKSQSPGLELSKNSKLQKKGRLEFKRILEPSKK